jgi:hypothetical protein
MKLKTALAAVLLAIAASGALASDISLASISVGSGTDIDNVSLGSFTVSSTSDINGYLYYVPTAVVPGLPITLTFSSATFTAVSLFSGGVEKYHVESGAAFSFANVAAGTYDLQFDGDTSTEGGKLGSLIGAQLNVTAVPEPESYAMLLAGLGLMGVIARRRGKSA